MKLYPCNRIPALKECDCNLWGVGTWCQGQFAIGLENPIPRTSGFLQRISRKDQHEPRRDGVDASTLSSCRDPFLGFLSICLHALLLLLVDGDMCAVVVARVYSGDCCCYWVS